MLLCRVLCSFSSKLCKLADKYLDPMQLVDELSMIYTTSILCYAIFTHDRSRLFSILLGIGLVVLSISITVRTSNLFSVVYQ